MDERSRTANQPTGQRSNQGGGGGGLDAAAWERLLRRWTASSTAMMARFGALHQLSALGGIDMVLDDHHASYDASLELYIDEIRSAWAEMTERGPMPDDAETTVDHSGAAHPRDFVADLVDDPSDPPATALFVGFSGAAAEDGHQRFYVDPSLTAFVDVPDDAVLLQHDIPSGSSSISGAYVWLRRDPEIVDQLRAALGDAARIQAEVWSIDGRDVTSTVPWTTGNNGSSSSGVTVSAFPERAPASTSDDIELPPGWPTT